MSTEQIVHQQKQSERDNHPVNLLLGVLSLSVLLSIGKKRVKQGEPRENPKTEVDPVELVVVLVVLVGLGL